MDKLTKEQIKERVFGDPDAEVLPNTYKEHVLNVMLELNEKEILTEELLNIAKEQWAAYLINQIDKIFNAKIF